MKIGILIIATNKYTKFIDPLVESINKYFLPEHEKQIFCFTNKMDEIFKEINITKIYQEHKEWPFITLGRYETFYKNKEYYDDVDVLYYLDADMLIHDYVGEEIIPKEKKLFAVVHPGYHTTLMQAFDRNPLSSAYVPWSEKSYVYHCGAVQGGTKEAYLDVCKLFMDNINKDLENNVIALAHDESHWNHYLVNNPASFFALDYNYCYPSDWTLDVPKKILTILKNHDEIRRSTTTKIGMLIIATNKYTIYVDPLVKTLNKYFLHDYEKTIFCFTDKMDEVYESQNIVKVFQEHKPWPYPSLKRYEIFYKNKELLKDMDILYYIDVDMLIHDYVGEEIIPKDKDLLAVIHPEYFRDKIQTFERNPQSLACVDYDHHVYHCGGVQGGKKESYLKVCEILMNNINTDLKNDIVAANFDESHWNKYLIDHPDSYTELNYNYCYPENWTLDIPKKILVIIKNHGEMRS